MRKSLQLGDRVQLSEMGMRGAKKVARSGTVLSVSKTRTQYRVKWDDVRWPQLIHADLLQPAVADASASDELI